MEVRNALFSNDRLYRYVLSILWDAGLPVVLWVMLNPSTADEFVDDPTIRRCKAYARAWGFGGVFIGNAFAWRSTDPSVLDSIGDPVGPHNNEALLWMAERAQIIMLGWGGERVAIERGKSVVQLLATRHGAKLHCLKKTKDGHPNHPLYLKKSLMPVPYLEAA